MPGSIFILQEDGRVVETRETPYDTEDLLQRLLADYPNLLAGDQINPAEPRRWLLVSREMRVSGDEGADRGSLDHLFLDQEAVPTLVEVKRSENTQIRREVVGQMLDYAANGVAFWSVEEIRSRFEGTCRERSIDPDERLSEFLGANDGREDFWQRVKTNLQAGRIRLIFVADEIPPGLRRIVEFLNGQMDPAEVLAIEIRQHIGEGLKALAPVLIGQTAIAQRAKSAGATAGRKWDEASFFADLQARTPELVPVARRLLDWARPRVTRIAWGTGTQDGSFVPVLHHGGIEHKLFAVYTYGSFETFFQYYRYKPPFTSENLRVEKLNRLNAIPGISLPSDGIARRPSFPLKVLLTEGRTEALLNVYEWVLEQILTD
jgi:hypothetical protein